MDHHHGPITAILAALTRLGEADTKQIAVEAGVAYSTTVKKLRGLAADGRAVRRDDGNGPALWRRGETPDETPADTTAQATGLDVGGAAPAADPSATTPEPTAPESGPAAHQLDNTTTDIHVDADGDGHGDAAADGDLLLAAATGSSPVPRLDDSVGDLPGRTVGDATGDTGDGAGKDSATAGTGPGHAVPGPDESPAGVDTPIPAPDPPGAGQPEAAERGTDQGKDSAGRSAVPPRRRKGKLRDEVLAVLQDHPDTAYKVSALSKLLDGASQGAITNALHKLVTDGTVTQTVERPATYQAN